MLASQWGRSFVVTASDVDDITNHLLEKETPMTTRELAFYLIEKRLNSERVALQDRVKGTKLYKPSDIYHVGDVVVFSKFNFSSGEVVAVREGQSPEYGTFPVIQVRFSHEDGDAKLREFASGVANHALNNAPQELPKEVTTPLAAQDIFDAAGIEITGRVIEALRANKELKQVAGYWFPRELVLDVEIGTLHLAETVLDMNDGGPLTTEDIIEQIGGIGNAAMTLQVFSLNLAMSQDKRFDEVGPVGKILWYLRRMEPEAVQKAPALLQYKAIEYDEDLLTDEMVDLETELDDEHTPIDFVGKPTKATTTLLYPHRRVGTLPLNAKTRQIFPNARTPRIYVTLIDEMDGQKYVGWVVHEQRYVYGLIDYYTKHKLPVGAYVTIRRGDKEAEILLSYGAHKPRTEYIPIFVPNNEQILFENKRRSIGAEYDPLLILGVDDLAAIDALTKTYAHKNLLTIIKHMMQELGKLSPQGTVHFTTLYSAVNVLRRCPPGPIFALLQANPEFEEMGDHYWKLNA
jgi:hypothetical protein